MFKVQDNTHGLMIFNDMEEIIKELLCTPELQRLRRIRHTGLAYYIYPGCEHSRFAHSLGASYVAALMGRKLAKSGNNILLNELLPDRESIRDFVIAALCHDIGHGPLSHPWERSLIGERWEKDDYKKEWAKRLKIDITNNKLKTIKWHELVTLGIIGWKEGVLFKKLNSVDPRLVPRIQKLLLGEYYLSYIPPLISSVIDVDRCDFILRDTYMAGSSYGKCDLDWLISCMSLEGVENEIVVGLDYKKSIHCIKEFINGRLALYETLYFHPGVMNIESLVELFFKRLRDKVTLIKGRVPLINSISPIIKVAEGKFLSQNEILYLDDNSFWSLLNYIVQDEKIDPVIKNIADRILNRKLLKKINISMKKINNKFKKYNNEMEFIKEINEDIKKNKKYKKEVYGDPEYCWILLPRKINTIDNQYGCYLVNKENKSIPPKKIKDIQEEIGLKNEKYEIKYIYAMPEFADLVESKFN